MMMLLMLIKILFTDMLVAILFWIMLIMMYSALHLFGHSVYQEACGLFDVKGRIGWLEHWCGCKTTFSQQYKLISKDSRLCHLHLLTELEQAPTHLMFSRTWQVVTCGSCIRKFGRAVQKATSSIARCSNFYNNSVEEGKQLPFCILFAAD